MAKEEKLKDKYSAFIAEISEIMGLGKPIDILKLCAATDLFFQPLKKRIAELEAQIEKMKSDVIKSFGDEYNVLVAKLLKEWEIKEK